MEYNARSYSISSASSDSFRDSSDMDPNPANYSGWKRAMQARKIPLHTTMTSGKAKGRKYDSASKIDERQFLLLRVLWPTAGLDVTDFARALEEGEFVPQMFVTWAEQSLHQDNNPSWVKYLENLPICGQPREQEKDRIQECGLFAHACWQQSAVCSIDLTQQPADFPTTAEHASEGSSDEAPEQHLRRSRRQSHKDPPKYHPDPSSSSPRSPDALPSSQLSLYQPPHQNVRGNVLSEDEQVVNFALISLLDTILLSVRTGHKLEATPKRRRFWYGDKWPGDTDGYLRMTPGTNRPEAIIEVKARPRRDLLPHVQRQEAAEMAAWLCNSRGRPGERWRVLIAQDYDEIWLIFAYYTPEYLEYCQTEEQSPLESDDFMVMRTHGPFSIHDRNAMSTFATFILAFGQYVGMSETPPVSPLQSDSWEPSTGSRSLPEAPSSPDDQMAIGDPGLPDSPGRTTRRRR